MRHLIVLFLLLVGCDYDDGPDPGDPGNAVDFIRFTEPGLFQEVFFDVVFQAGELATDVLPGPTFVWVPQLGPGTATMMPIDDDFAPYPNPVSGAPKQTPHNGLRDKRFWVQFAGGAWNRLSIEAGTEHRFRASSSPPSTIPKTEYLWCAFGRPCKTWLEAVHQRVAQCYKYSLNGYELRVNPYDCYWHHPRMHWRVQGCGNCPVPASDDDLQVFERRDE